MKISDFVIMHKKRCLFLDILNNILRLISDRKIQQRDLSDFLGLSKNTITGWKNGNNTSYMKYLPKIAEFFDVSVDYLLSNEEQETTLPPNFTYALYDEITHDLTEEQIEQLKKFADFLRNN